MISEITTRKYPKTPHLPWSECVSREDKRLGSVVHFLNNPIIITEKMDGSNVCLTSSLDVFARSHSGAPGHPSFDYLKAIHASLRSKIDSRLSIFAEWCFAVHSIEYEGLDSYLNIFGVLEKNKTWWSWWEVEASAKYLGIPTVPVIGITVITSQEELIKETTPGIGVRSVYGGDTEGRVVRLAGEFNNDDFMLCVAKWVRKNHVQTDEHWTQQEIKKQKVKK